MNINCHVRPPAVVASVCLISTLLLCSICLANTDSQTHPHRGHRWVRSHPYTIMGLVRGHPNPFDIEKYRAAGFNALLPWESSSFDQILPMAAQAGVPFHVHLEKWGEAVDKRWGQTVGAESENNLREALKDFESQEKRAIIEKIIAHSGCVGFMVNDEVSHPQRLRYTRHMLKWLRKLHPDAIAYSNMHPAGHDNDLAYGSVDRYFDEFAAMVEPDILMTDVYPLGPPEGTSSNYFQLIAAVRTAALNHGMPYWMFIQSFQSEGNWIRRLPSESDLRFQMFVPLTHGYTGIGYFTYDIAFKCGLIDESGEPNRLYHAAAKANPEVENVGAAMRFLTSIDVRYVPGHHADGNLKVPNKLPRDTTAWTRGAGGDNRITSVAIDGAGHGKDVLLGFFHDDDNEQYFMVTNLWHGANASSDDRALTVSVKFAPHIRKLYRLDRISGDTIRVNLNRGILRTSLPGGTGDLYKYTATPFPGMN